MPSEVYEVTSGKLVKIVSVVRLIVLCAIIEAVTPGRVEVERMAWVTICVCVDGDRGGGGDGDGGGGSGGGDEVVVTVVMGLSIAEDCEVVPAAVLDVDTGGGGIEDIAMDESVDVGVTVVGGGGSDVGSDVDSEEGISEDVGVDVSEELSLVSEMASDAKRLRMATS
jgi:hypothetical protein